MIVLKRDQVSSNVANEISGKSGAASDGVGSEGVDGIQGTNLSAGGS